MININHFNAVSKFVFCAGVSFLYNYSTNRNWNTLNESESFKKADSDTSVLVVTSPGDLSQNMPSLPKFEVLKKNDTDKWDSIIEEGLFFTREAHKAIQNLPKTSIKTKKQADHLVQELAKQKFFAWEYTQDGCFDRAQTTYFTLKAMGMDEEEIRQEYVHHCAYQGAIGTGWRGEKAYWNWHTAASINLDGKKYVLDPSINPQKAIPFSLWVNQINLSDEVPTPCQLTSLKFNDKGAIHWNVLNDYRKSLECFLNDGFDCELKLRYPLKMIEAGARTTFQILTDSIKNKFFEFIEYDYIEKFR